MKTRIISIIAVAGLVFSSCMKEEKTEVTDNREVKFSSGIMANLTKVGGADGNQWQGNEAIGIFMVGNGTTTVAEGTGNIQYTTTSTGTSATFTSTTPIYYPVVQSTKVDFITYHPYNASITGYVYPINVANQSDQSAIDLMTTFVNNGGAGYDKTNSTAINLNFTHKLAKVVINVTNGAGVPNLTGLTVAIDGMNTKANFDLATVIGTDNGISTESDILSITPFDAGSNSYEAILLPVTLSNTHIVRFTVGGNTHTWVMTNNSGSITQFSGGMKYTFNVTIQRDDVKISSSITNWNSQAASTGIGS